MAAVLHRTTKEYIPSANTPDFPTQDWIINPDLSAVTGFASKYWTITVDAVTLMNQTQRDAVDAAEAAAFLSAMRAAAKAGYDAAAEDLHKLIKAVALVTLDQINILRADAARPAISAATMKTAIDNKVDTL